jgi:hypothetical protein
MSLPLAKYVDYDSIDHPDDATVQRILAVYKLKHKKRLEQEERNKANDQVLRNYKIGKYKNK